MLSYQTHPKELNELQEKIASGRFYSLTFIKKDGSIRYLNGHKKFIDKVSPDDEKRGKWNRQEKNILIVWDRNAIDRQTGKKGAFRSVKLDRLLDVKVGDFVKDYTDENSHAIEEAGITPEQLEGIRQKMKISGMVQEEMVGMLQEAEFFTINDIPEMLQNKGFEPKSIELLNKQAQRTYENKGDKGIKEWIENILGEDVFIISKGKFSFSPIE